MAFLRDGVLYTRSMAEAASQVLPNAEYTISNREENLHIVDIVYNDLMLSLYNALQSVRVTVRLVRSGQSSAEMSASYVLLLLYPEMSGRNAAPGIWHNKHDVVPVVVNYLCMFLEKSELLDETQKRWTVIQQLFQQNRAKQNPAQGESSEHFANRVVAELKRAWIHKRPDDLADWLNACRNHDCPIPLAERVRAEVRLWWLTQGPMTF